MKVSIITVSYNSATTIRDTIKSVLQQTHPYIDYIIIDGGSTDGTVSVIKEYSDKISHFVSEPDNGIYSAINNGLKVATGDVVGILNSDDIFYNNNIIKNIADEFTGNNYVDAIIGDVVFIKPDDQKKIIRYYSSANFSPSKFRYGIMPAHPSFYVRKEHYEKFGYYKEDYLIGSDFDLMIRFLYTEKLKYKYLNIPFVKMRMGGISNRSLKSRIVLNKEIMRSCRENGIMTNYMNIYSKYFSKIFEYFRKN